MRPSIASGGISTFGSLIVKSFGYNAFTTILFNIPFGAMRKEYISFHDFEITMERDSLTRADPSCPELVAILGSGWLAQRFQRKGLVITAISVFPIIGAILMLTIPRSQKGVLLFGYYLVCIRTSVLVLPGPQC